MQLKNSSQSYGWIAVIIHWLMAVAIIGMFFLGQFIVDLDYYSPWYHTAPDLHVSIGLLLGGLLLFRFIWRLSNSEPAPEGKAWEIRIAHWVHLGFYALIAAIIVSGYLIATADGQGVSFFGWFDIPATIQGIDHQEDIAGEVHEVLAALAMLLAGIHGGAALKHHFIDHDGTLLKMLGRSRPAKN